MIVTCKACGRRYSFDQAKMAGRQSATVACLGCKAPIAIVAESPGDQTQRLAADANLIPAHSKVPDGSLSRPAGRRVSLAVLDGKDSGRIFTIEGTSAVLGRGDADIVLDDQEVSRQHARVEIHGARIVLRDLDSTNGTFVDEVKIAETEMESRSEFRIGGTRLMLIVAEVGADPEKTP
jgi:hypothetical protein